MNTKIKHRFLSLNAIILAFLLSDASVTANADVITTLTLNGVTYADGGTATGSITLDYPVSGNATIISFDVTLTSPTLTDGYGTSVAMIGPTPAGATSWFDAISNPFGPNKTQQLLIYGSSSDYPQMDFYFDVPGSLITGGPPTGPVQFDSTAQGEDGAWFILGGGVIEPQSLVTGGTLDPSNSESTNSIQEPISISLLVVGFFGLAASRRGKHGRRLRPCSQ